MTSYAASTLSVLLLSVAHAQADDAPPQLNEAAGLFERKCPFVRADFEAADKEFRSGPWQPAGRWGATPLGRYGGWRNAEDTITISFQNYRFSDSSFWQCRVSVLVPDLDTDPQRLIKGTLFRDEEFIDGSVDPISDGGFAGMWKVNGGLFSSVNVIYDRKILSMVKMVISKEAEIVGK